MLSIKKSLLLSVLLKIVFSFSCEDVYLDTKETLYKATEGVKTIESKTVLSHGIEYNTWYIDPCRSVEKFPENNDKKDKCPENSRVCLIKSFVSDKDSKKQILDVKGYAINNPSKEPSVNKGDYILDFDGEKDSGYSTEFKFTCAGNNDSDPVVNLKDKTVNIEWKGICVSDSKESPVDDGDKKKGDDDNKKNGGFFFIKFILMLVLCYFVIGAAYNFFALNKRGLEIIPNIDVWLSLFDWVSDKISSCIGRRDYRPILQ